VTKIVKRPGQTLPRPLVRFGTANKCIEAIETLLVKTAKWATIR